MISGPKFTIPAMITFMLLSLKIAVPVIQYEIVGFYIASDF